MMQRAAKAAAACTRHTTARTPFQRVSKAVATILQNFDFFGSPANSLEHRVVLFSFFFFSFFIIIIIIIIIIKKKRIRKKKKKRKGIVLNWAL
jgi:hypothetical protein